MAEVIEVEIEQASEQEQRGRKDGVVSVLSCLRPPVASDLSRKRKLATNPGKGNQRSKSSSPNLTAAKSEPKSNSAKDRAKRGTFLHGLSSASFSEETEYTCSYFKQKTQREQRKAVAER